MLWHTDYPAAFLLDRVFLFGWSAVFLPPPETSLAGWLAAVKEGLAPLRGHRAHTRPAATSPWRPAACQRRSARCLAKAPSALMCSFGVVVPHPLIKVGLQLRNRPVGLLAQRDLVELGQDGLVEPLADAVGLRASGLGSGMVEPRVATLRGTGRGHPEDSPLVRAMTGWRSRWFKVKDGCISCRYVASGVSLL